MGRLSISLPNGSHLFAARIVVALSAAPLACGPGGPGATSEADGEPTSTSEGAPATDDSAASTTSAGPETSDSSADASTSAGTEDEPCALPPQCERPLIHRGALEILPETDTAALACVVEVQGSVTIRGHERAATVADLRRLSRVTGALSLVENDGADVLGALACLREVGLQLSVSDNGPGVKDLSGLTRLEQLGSLRVNDNEGLTGLDGLDSLKTVSALRVSGNTALTSLSGLAGIESADSLYVGGNPALVELGALTLDLPHDFATLDIRFNDALTSLAGLEGVSYSGKSLNIAITDSAALADITALAPLVSPGDEVALQLSSLPQLSSLAGLEGANELVRLWLSDLPKVSSLAPLSALVEVFRLDLFDLPALPSLHGLGALESVFELNLGECHQVNLEPKGLALLASLEGLDSLVHLNLLSLSHNASLSSLDGAPDLATLDTAVFLDNPELAQDEIDAFMAPFGGATLDVCTDPSRCTCPEINPW